jgi:hypothetical protein
MNELFDKFLIRIIFTIFLCLILYLYKYAHSFLYPQTKNQVFKRFYPSKNSADTIHLFARLIGIGLVFSEFYFFMGEGIIFALFDFLVASLLAFFLYLGSLYVVESIVLYNFEYEDEIIKRKNFSYAIICFAHSLGLAYLLKVILNISKETFKHVPIYIVLLWLFSMVTIGIASKFFPLISKLKFQKLLIQKNLGLSFSYFGFFMGLIIILSSSLNHPLLDIQIYSIEVILKIILSLIILPIFRKVIPLIFRMQDDISPSSKPLQKQVSEGPATGYGIYEGIVFLTSALFTTVITEHITFNSF